MREAVHGLASVQLQGRQVGELRFTAGGSRFRYTDDLLDPDHQVLGQLFEESPRARYENRTGLPNWFANLLPERGSGLHRYYTVRSGNRHLDDARLLLRERVPHDALGECGRARRAHGGSGPGGVGTRHLRENPRSADPGVYGRTLRPGTG